MKKYLSIVCLFSIAVSYYSCKKGPGEGGRASITGKVHSVNYNATMTSAQDSGYLGGQKVYIIYGDETAVGDDQDTNPDGSYEFLYLRPGKYKVYTFTKTTPNHLDTAVVQDAEITSRKQRLELPVMRIKTSKN